MKYCKTMLWQHSVSSIEFHQVIVHQFIVRREEERRNLRLEERLKIEAPLEPSLEKLLSRLVKE